MPTHFAGIIPLRSERDPLRPAPTYPIGPEDPFHLSYQLWTWQQEFDHAIHESRNLYYPVDARPNTDNGGERPQIPIRSTNELRRFWMWGIGLAIKSEIRELKQAFDKKNETEELVDMLHFIMSGAEKLGMTPWELGRFEDRFEAGRRDAKQKKYLGWRQAFKLEYSDLEDDIDDLFSGATGEIRASWKWWKNQPDEFPLDAFKAALRRIDHRMMILMSLVFPTPQAVYDAYKKKVDENHARQRGESSETGREEYKAPNPSA